jgi:hypothetical protein
MKMNWMLSAAVVAMSVTAAAGAQSAGAMGKPSKGDAMNMTYTGCDQDDMAMKSDAAKTMTHEQTPMADEQMNAMPSKSFALAGSANLNKHFGRKVSVTGSVSEGSMGAMRQDVSTLTIKSLKVIAKSCS